MMSPKKEILKLSSTTGLELKEENGEFFVEGFLATTHPDRSKEVVPKSTLQKIVDKINSRDVTSDAGAASWHHDRADLNLTGRAISAELRPMNDNNWGAFAKVHMNKEHPDFKQNKYEVENNFVSGFSIEYIPKETHNAMLNGQEFKVLDDIDLRGFGFASPRSIVNPEASITGFGSKENQNLAYKEIISLKTLGKEVIPMNETPEQKTTPTDKEATVQPEAKVTPQPEAQVEEKKEVNAKEYADFVKYKEFESRQKQELEMKEMIKKELSSIVPELKTKLDDSRDIAQKEIIECKEFVNWKEMMTGEKQVSAHEGFVRAKEMAEKMGLFKPEMFYKSSTSPFTNGRMSFKSGGNYGEQIQLKALETDTNKSTDTDYLQSAAELSDVYSAAIINMLNQKTTLFGLLPKDDMSMFSNIQWRAENVANSSSGAYFEGSSITKGNTTRQKLNEHFKYYSVGVQVTGQMIASARGAIGDVFNAEIEAATRALLSTMNTALFAEKGAFTDEEFLGLEYLCDSTGNTTLYGLTRDTTNLLGASGSEYSAQSSAAITRDTLRTAIRTLVVNGSEKNSLFFVTHPLQVQMIKRECMDDWQRIDTSARAGFEGSIVFDGYPIFEDKDCQSDDIYLLDPTYLRIGVQVPVTFEALAQSDDSKSGFLKFYGNLYATAPKKAAYMIQGLATS